MCNSVAVAFASREIATLGEFRRPRPEIHVGVDALGMAALAGLRTIISHGRWSSLGRVRFDARQLYPIYDSACASFSHSKQEAISMKGP